MTKPRHDCWTATARPHPWHGEAILDCACGFDGRLTHPKCLGCHRAREESTLDQLRALDARHSEDGIR